MASISPGFGCDLCRVCRVCLYQAFMRLTPARTSYKGQPYIPYIDRSIPPFLCLASVDPTIRWRGKHGRRYPQSSHVETPFTRALVRHEQP